MENKRGKKWSTGCKLWSESEDVKMWEWEINSQKKTMKERDALGKSDEESVWDMEEAEQIISRERERD
jgi:hypothetical protein